MTLRAKYTFNVEAGDCGLWYATSADVKGLLVAEHTLHDCLSEIAPMLERLDLARQLGPGDVTLKEPQQ